MSDKERKPDGGSGKKQDGDGQEKPGLVIEVILPDEKREVEREPDTPEVERKPDKPN